jgi:3-phosphoshikimate 1-carboxyvinyltransferase
MADSRQGDRRVCDILASGGTRIECNPAAVVAVGRRTRPIVADLRDGPDMFPALASVAAVGVPGSRLSGLEHLRHKESDRLAVMVENLSALGARFRGTGSTLEVVETLRTEPDTVRPVSAAGDHRIAMAMAVAGLAAGPLRLDDPAAVTKSFPDFWSGWERLVAGPTMAGEP